jgi:hypothetical protein
VVEIQASALPAGPGAIALALDALKKCEQCGSDEKIGMVGASNDILGLAKKNWADLQVISL